MRPLPLDESKTEACQIECWHGYFKCDFVAIDAGTNREIARSRLFRWRHSEPPPRDGPALAAYRELVGQLEALGWEAIGGAHPWYAQRFRLVVGAGEKTAEKESPVEKEPLAGKESPAEKEESLPGRVLEWLSRSEAESETPAETEQPDAERTTDAERPPETQ
jgi:hypothetical protein